MKVLASCSWFGERRHAWVLAVGWLVVEGSGSSWTNSVPIVEGVLLPWIPKVAAGRVLMGFPPCLGGSEADQASWLLSF